jgi:protein-S-isoprenylcysteine O-methyltransferase Ste14
MSSLELKIPPPVVALFLAALMWLTTFVAPSLDLAFGFRLGVALVLVFIGQSISISGMVAFRRAKTTINPIKANAASSLVTLGVYRFTRNPMYLGLLLTLLAWAVYLSSPVAVLWIIAYVLYINRFQILPEERVLLSLFGPEYATYQGEVRRWL